ncbi:RlpA-like double-psi beta-barrel domain-containing protein [Rhodotorula paludigena]|uniref:RlpA-like double-psi beta-barrel domain-containing protein n=1 Tax=Rhodotorula paludigena TaxID=86838 RepID=UPI0031733A3B
MRSLGRSGGRGGRALDDRDGGGDDDRSYELVNQDDDEYEYRSDKKQGSCDAADDSDTGSDQTGSNGRSQAKRDTDGSHSQPEGSDGDYSSHKAGAGGRGSDTDDDEQTTPKHAHGGDAEKEESALKKYKWWWIGGAVLALIVVIALAAYFILNRKSTSSSSESASSSDSTASTNSTAGNAVSSAPLAPLVTSAPILDPDTTTLFETVFKTQTEASKPVSTGSSSAGGEDGVNKESTTATWFDNDQHSTACRTTGGDKDLLVALPPDIFGSNGSKASPLCGEKLKVWQPASNQTITVKVVDVCNVCPSSTAIDLSRAAFLKLSRPLYSDDKEALRAGILDVQWWFADSTLQSQLDFGFQEWSTGADEDAGGTAGGASGRRGSMNGASRTAAAVPSSVSIGLTDAVVADDEPGTSAGGRSEMLAGAE